MQDVVRTRCQSSEPVLPPTVSHKLLLVCWEFYHITDFGITTIYRIHAAVWRNNVFLVKVVKGQIGLRPPLWSWLQPTLANRLNFVMCVSIFTC